METNRNNLLARLHIVMSQTGALEHKEELYAGYGVCSSRDMTDEQLCELIESLERPEQPPQQAPRRSSSSDSITRKRSDILKLITGSPSARDPRKRGLGVPNDWAVINPFIVRHAGRVLPYLSEAELVKFHHKLCAMRDTDWYYGKKEDKHPCNAAPEPQPAVNQPQQPQLALNIPWQPRGLMS